MYIAKKLGAILCTSISASSYDFPSFKTHRYLFLIFILETQNSRRKITTNGRFGRPAGSRNIDWQTIGTYICADPSSKAALKSTRQEARTHALSIDGAYISAGSKSAYLSYYCDDHQNCAKRRRVIYEDDECLVQESPEDHAKEINPESRKRGIHFHSLTSISHVCIK